MILVALAAMSIGIAIGSSWRHPPRPYGAGAPSRPTADGSPTEATATLEALFRALERADTGALGALYAGDSTIIIEGSDINHSWRDYRDNHLAYELQEWHQLRYRPTDIEVHVVGDVAWATFAYTMQAMLWGRRVDVAGRGTAVLQRWKGHWIVRQLQTTAEPR
jgi:ketosteroid isomerase-like protein